MKFGSKRAVPGCGSHSNGKREPSTLPRMAITFPESLARRIAWEAAQNGVSFAEIVRNRLTSSYNEGDSR